MLSFVFKKDFVLVVVFNFMGINISWVIGFVLVGVLIIVVGLVVLFVLNVLSFIGILIVFVFWKLEVCMEKWLLLELVFSVI